MHLGGEVKTRVNWVESGFELAALKLALISHCNAAISWFTFRQIEAVRSQLGGLRDGEALLASRLAEDVDNERFRHGRQLQYLAGVVVVKPALQVDGIPAWYQTAVLENPQFSRGVVACGDDFMEGVFQRHRVVVSSLVLMDQQGGREGRRPRSISSKNVCCLKLMNK